MRFKLLNFKSLLQNAGISIERLPTRAELSERKASVSKGNVVEFVGPGGIGKSTIFENLKPKLKRDWFFEHHTRVTNVESLPDLAVDSFLSSVFQSRVDLLGSLDMSLLRNVTIAKRMAEIVQMEIAISSIEFSRGFVLEEGVSHFFAEQIPDFGSISELKIFKNRGFVFVLPKETSTLRTRRANRTKTAVGRQDTRSSAESDRKLVKEIEIYVTLEKILADIGCPTLIVPAEGSVEENGKRVLEFISSYIGKTIST